MANYSFEFFKGQHVAPHSSPLFHQEDANEKYQFSNYNGNTYLQLCVPFFHFSVSWLSEMQSGVIYFKTQGSTQPYVSFLTVVFCSCLFVFGRTYMAQKSLTLHEPVSVVS